MFRTDPPRDVPRKRVRARQLERAADQLLLWTAGEARVLRGLRRARLRALRKQANRSRDR
jgi:hypothetical protein